jgi:hypothetical protein
VTRSRSRREPGGRPGPGPVTPGKFSPESLGCARLPERRYVAPKAKTARNTICSIELFRELEMKIKTSPKYRESKIPCAKTVLSFMKEPSSKTARIDPEKMNKLLNLIRHEFTRPENMTRKAMEEFLKSQQVLDIFVPPESKLNAVKCHATIAPSAHTGSGTEDSTQADIQVFKNIRKHNRRVPAQSTPSPLKPGEVAFNHP